MSARTIAIGDIHGCVRALDGVLDAVAPTTEDTLIVLGDVVDRGPRSREVIDRLLALQRQCRLIALRGNHEEMMLDALDGRIDARVWLQFGGRATITSYGGSLEGVPESHRRFLKEMRLFHETETHFFIHANYVATLPLDQQPLQVALWEHLTAMVPPPHVSGKCAVVGHTPQYDGEVLDLDHLICLDTYCVGGRWLTAMSFPDKQIWQVDGEGRLRDAGRDEPNGGKGLTP